LGNFITYRIAALLHTCLVLLGISAQQSHGASMIVGGKESPTKAAYGNILIASEKHHQALPMVMKPYTGAKTFIPMTWSKQNQDRAFRARWEFLNGFNQTTWRNFHSHSFSASKSPANTLNKPFDFPYEDIANSGSISANGKVIFSAKSEQKKLLKNDARRLETSINIKKESAFIKDGKVDIDLILLISASVSGLALILIPERKKKRALIQETNLALLRRPRQ
jgi:hypothetical protein